MEDFYILVRIASYYDKEPSENIVAVFTDEGEAERACGYAASNWSEWTDRDCLGQIYYEVRLTTAFIAFEEMLRWNDYPSRALSGCGGCTSSSHMSRMSMKVRLLSDTAILPTYGSEEAAGADLHADLARPVQILPHQTEMIPTGIAIAVPKGYFGALYARSGLATRQGLRPANAVGVIDSDYTGEIMVALHNDSDTNRYVDPHERIAQLVIQPYETVGFDVVEKLEDTARGTGGFGSTGGC